MDIQTAALSLVQLIVEVLQGVEDTLPVDNWLTGQLSREGTAVLIFLSAAQRRRVMIVIGGDFSRGELWDDGIKALDGLVDLVNVFLKQGEANFEGGGILGRSEVALRLRFKGRGFLRDIVQDGDGATGGLDDALFLDFLCILRGSRGAKVIL